MWIDLRMKIDEVRFRMKEQFVLRNSRIVNQ
jgi:hypothetical protein